MNPLPMPWVEKIFLKLTLTFGRDFLGRWEGVPIDAVKIDWAHELRGFAANPAAIAYGLENCLGGKPPTVHDFKAVCQRRPEPTLASPAPPANPERVAQELAKLSKPVQPVDTKDWARRIMTRKMAGEKIHPATLGMAMTAIGPQA